MNFQTETQGDFVWWIVLTQNQNWRKNVVTFFSDVRHRVRLIKFQLVVSCESHEGSDIRPRDDGWFRVGLVVLSVSDSRLTSTVGGHVHCNGSDEKTAVLQYQHRNRSLLDLCH